MRSTRIGRLKGVDHLFTGKVDRIDKDFVTQLINTGVVPISGLPPGDGLESMLAPHIPVYHSHQRISATSFLPTSGVTDRAVRMCSAP